MVDSPLLLSLVYGAENHYKSFAPLVREVFDSFHNLNFFIGRPDHYCAVGRSQTPEESQALDHKVRHMLAECGVPYETYPVDRAAEPVLAQVRRWLARG